MSKPGTLPVWATTGPKTTPSGGKQAAGFSPGERGAAQHFNWYMHLVYLWIVFIDAIFTADGSIVLPVDQSLTVSGIGTIKHGDRGTSKLYASGALFSTGTGAGQVVGTSVQYALTGFAYSPIEGLIVGDRIKTIKISGDATGAAVAPVFTFYRGGDGSSTLLATTITATVGSALGVFEITLTLDTPLTLVQGIVPMIKAASGDGGATQTILYQLKTTFDHP